MAARQQSQRKKTRSKASRQMDDLAHRAARLESALHNEFQRQAERDNRTQAELNEASA